MDPERDRLAYEPAPAQARRPRTSKYKSWQKRRDEYLNETGKPSGNLTPVKLTTNTQQKRIERLERRCDEMYAIMRALEERIDVKRESIWR